MSIDHPSPQQEQIRHLQPSPEERKRPETPEIGTYGETVAAFDQLKDAWRTSDEIRTVRQVIDASKRAQELSGKLSRAFSEKMLDVNDLAQVEAFAQSYDVNARSAQNSETKARFEGWAKVMRDYVRAFNEQKTAKEAIQGFGELQSPQAREGLLAYQRNQEQGTLQKLSATFDVSPRPQEASQRLAEAKQNLDQEMNKGRALIDLSNPSDVQRFIDGWQRQSAAAEDPAKKAGLDRWIKKLEDFQALQAEATREAATPDTSVSHSNESPAKEGVDRFMEETQNIQTSSTDKAIEHIRQLRQRDPLLVQRHILEESLRQPSIKPDTKTSAETVLRSYKADAAAEAGERAWFQEHFAEKYSHIQERQQQVRSASDALEDWRTRYSHANLDDTSTLSERYREFAKDHEGTPNMLGAFISEVQGEIREEHQSIRDELESMRREKPTEYQRQVAPLLQERAARQEEVRRTPSAKTLEGALSDVSYDMDAKLRRSNYFHDLTQAFLRDYPKKPGAF